MLEQLFPRGMGRRLIAARVLRGYNLNVVPGDALAQKSSSTYAVLPTTSTSMAHPSPKIHFSHSQTCVFYAVNASKGTFKAVLRTFLEDVGVATRPTQAH